MNFLKSVAAAIDGSLSGLGEATARLLSAPAIATDVNHRDQVKSLVDAAAQTFRRIDMMINYAGLMPQSPLERMKIREWKRMIDVNLKGVLYGIAAALTQNLLQAIEQTMLSYLTRSVRRRAATS
jgi:NAD(P)-dependent dehydrogenase (short-subunit alcohol dehydrogenase family)